MVLACCSAFEQPTNQLISARRGVEPFAWARKPHEVADRLVAYPTSMWEIPCRPDAALSRSKLEAIVPSDLWVPVGGAGRRSALAAKAFEVPTKNIAAKAPLSNKK
ncbi:hypothetical protein D9M68_732240 [compost metagenome]